MTRFLSILFLFLFVHNSQAQDDKVYYFEDSDVQRSFFGIEASFNPGVSSRNLIQPAELDLDDDLRYYPGRAKSLFAFSYGMRLIVSPTKSLDIRVGLNRRSNGFKQVDIGITNGVDTVRADIRTRIETIDIPIILAFKNGIGTDWKLEYGVGWELSFVQSYKNTYENVDNTVGLDIPDFSEYKDNVDGVKHGLIIQLGGAYVLNPKTSFFMLPNFRYMFTPLITDGSQAKDAPYSIGLDMGIRYRF
jgi:hypothetical protein